MSVQVACTIYGQLAWISDSFFIGVCGLIGVP
jgi:hypothetical protein